MEAAGHRARPVVGEDIPAASKEHLESLAAVSCESIWWSLTFASWNRMERFVRQIEASATSSITLARHDAAALSS